MKATCSNGHDFEYQESDIKSHFVMCGDSTDKASVEMLMNGTKADMVFTDPPYGMDVDVDYDSMFSNDKRHKNKGDRFDKVIGDNEQYDPSHIFDMFDCEEVVLWGADYYRKLLPDGGSWFVWDKRTDSNMDKVVGNTFELAWSKSKHKREVARILWSGHHGMAKDDTKTRVHPTQKPVELVAWFFDRLKGSTVVDLFLGSGSTLIACEQTDRTCYGMELDPRYVDVIRKRWAKLVHPESWEEQWQALTPEVNHGKAEAN
jgi:DNA modification methylase